MKDERRKMKMKKQLSQIAAHQIGTCIYTEAYIMRILKSETFRNVFAVFIQIFTNDFLMLYITQAYTYIDRYTIYVLQKYKEMRIILKKKEKTIRKAKKKETRVKKM